MDSNLLTLAEGSEVGANEQSSFQEELVTDLSPNALGGACDYRHTILETLTRHGRYSSERMKQVLRGRKLQL